MDLRFITDDPVFHAKADQRVRNDSEHRRLSRTLRMYYRLRGLLPLPVRQSLQALVGRSRRQTADRLVDPDPLLDSLLRALDSRRPLIAPWPQNARSALVLTHDVETFEGTRNILAIAEIEQQLGLRSCWNFVPYKYKIDSGLIDELIERGFEIGIHGYNNDGALFKSLKVFEHRAKAINLALAKYKAVGFRSPMLHRNLNWLQLLNIEYDASCFDNDPYQPMPGGIALVWPFVCGRFVELPYTLPQDHTLFVMLGLDDDSIWRRKLDVIRAHHGMALMLTHPDYLAKSRHLDIYRGFLEHALQADDSWHALPTEVCRWWRIRDETRTSVGSHGETKLIGPAADQAHLLRVVATASGVHFEPAEQVPAL